MSASPEDLDSTQWEGPPRARLSKFGWLWLGAIAFAFLLYLLVEQFDNASELTPDHSDILGYCFVGAGLVGIASVIIGFSQSSGPVVKRLGALLGFGILGFLSTLLLSSTLADIIENRTDFPADKTETRWALLPIQRAYRMDSRTGSSWIIQPVIWTNIDVSHADFKFMLSHRGWNGKGSEPDDVSSDGYFCAKVLVQKSGDALRVLHSGSLSLPEGSVGICSEMSQKDSSLPLIS